MALSHVILPYLKSLIVVEYFFFVLFFVTGILFVLMMRHLQNMSSVARGTGAVLANASMYIGQMIDAAIAGMLFATSHFILIGSFTALLYIGALFLFRKSENLLKIVKQELHHKACINISQIRINKSVNT